MSGLPSGKKLFDEVTDATGLPGEAVSKELEALLAGSGLQKNDITLEELRQVLAAYVQDVLLAAKEEYEREQELISPVLQAK